MYRKPTDTGLIMQYTSICPKSWKLGLINFYLNRALNICSNFTAFKDELTKIENLLLKNQYPKNLIESKINKFLEAHKIDNSTFNKMKILTQKMKRKQKLKNFKTWKKCSKIIWLPYNFSLVTYVCLFYKKIKLTLLKINIFNLFQHYFYS